MEGEGPLTSCKVYTHPSHKVSKCKENNLYGEKAQG